MKRFVDWKEYCNLIKKLSDKITPELETHQFDQILCLARGGMLLGDALSRIYDLPLSVLFTSSYRIAEKKGELYIDNQIAKQNNILGKRILLVDDLVDSGTTLEGVVQYLKVHHQVEYIKTATLWAKTSSVFIPDYCVEYTTSQDWIVQPFEIFEELNIHKSTK
jgi:hypoxanthine phosphoribosyltransferase